MERVEIIGNLVRDPDVRETQNGSYVCVFDVAVNRRVNGRDEARYYSVNAWEKLGEVCAKYLAKGRKVFVSGRPDAQAWIGRDTGEARGAIRITASNVEFLSGANAAAEAAPAAAPAAKGEGFTEVQDDELPF